MNDEIYDSLDECLGFTRSGTSSSVNSLVQRAAICSGNAISNLVSLA
jgi:hypothetical protein